MSRKWICILGASSGFGAATARVFAEKGYGIFGVHLDRRSGMPAVEALVAELRAHDVPVVFHNGNAASADEMQSAIASVQEEMSDGDTVQVLMHSLAFGTLREFFPESGRALNKKQMDMTLDVMAHSLVYWTQALVEAGLLVEGGRVFAMTSSGSLAAWKAYGAVSAAKCALESHIRQIAVELAPKGISANAIMAGVTRTAALEKIPGADLIEERALARNPSGRLTRPEDVATCIYDLSGPGTAWLTGNILRVDGGESVAG